MKKAMGATRCTKTTFRKPCFVKAENLALPMPLRCTECTAPIESPYISYVTGCTKRHLPYISYISYRLIWPSRRNWPCMPTAGSPRQWACPFRDKRRGYPPDHLRWIRATLDNAGRCITGKAPSAKDVLERVARDSSREYGVNVTPRMVRDYLAKYRKTCR